MGKRVTAFTAMGALAAAWFARRARRRHRGTSERSEMSEAKQIARRVLDELFNEGRLESADELFAPGAVSHDPAQPEPTIGPEGVKQSVTGYRTAFPDVRCEIEDQVAEGGTVATRWTARGTHQGELMGIAPTGRQATVTGITIDRIEDGKIVESWTNWDTLGLLQQLGVVPAAAAPV